MATMVNLKEDRISDSLFLLSRKNYGDAVKIAYDILINLTFKYGADKRLRQMDLEARGKDTLCLLYDFLTSKGVNNVAQLLPELHLLTIYFNNYSREVLKSDDHDYKIKVLAMNLIGLLEYLENGSSSSQYHIGMIESDLRLFIKSELAKEIYEATKQYFDILILSKEIAKSNFWEDINRFNPSDHNNSVFTAVEFEQLMHYKSLIDEHQFELSKGQRDTMEDIWGTYLDIDNIKQKISTQYYILHMLAVLEKYRRADKSSGKYGADVYKREKENAFHKNIYPYLTGKGYDLVLSELNSGNQRHDILIYDSNTDLSCIIELKVNELKNVNDNIAQLLRYMEEVEDKPHHYIVPPQFGVLLTYYTGTEDLASMDFEKKASNHNELYKISPYFYLLKETDERPYPLLIGLINGK